MIHLKRFSVPAGENEGDELETWTCDKCEMVAAFSPFQRLQHVKSHEREAEAKKAGERVFLGSLSIARNKR